MKPTELYTPSQVGELALREIEERVDQSVTGIRTGIGSIDKYLKPLRPGNLCVIQAYTSNYKTGFMMAWARMLAHEIVAEAQRETEKGNIEEAKKALNKCVMFISWEDTVEEVGVYDLVNATSVPLNQAELTGKMSDADRKKLQEASFKRGALPLWVIGESCIKLDDNPPLTMGRVEAILSWLKQNMTIRPIAIFLDYINLIVPEGERSWGDNRRTDIMQLVFRAHRLAIGQGCPVIAGAQSRRETNDKPWKMPSKRDPQESAAFEQYCQQMLGLWMPGTTESLGEPLKGPNNKAATYADKPLLVTENLLIVAINKQKRGKTNIWIPLYVDPEKNKVAGMATEPAPFATHYDSHPTRKLEDEVERIPF